MYWILALIDLFFIIQCVRSMFQYGATDLLLFATMLFVLVFVWICRIGIRDKGAE